MSPYREILEVDQKTLARALGEAARVAYEMSIKVISKSWKIVWSHQAGAHTEATHFCGAGIEYIGCGDNGRSARRD